MTTQVIRALDLILAGLMAGTLFGVLAGFNPKPLSAQTYIEQQQAVIRALNTLMPVLGLITIVLTIAAAFMQKQNQAVFVTLLVAAGFFILGGLITKYGNQPINSIIITWDKANPPANWMEMRDRWWTLHIYRALATIISFGLIVWSNVRNGNPMQSAS